jgi:hypothetical protein
MPLANRGRLVIHDVVDSGGAALDDDCGGGGRVVDVHDDHHPFASPISGTRRRRSRSIIDWSSIPVSGP